MKKFYHNTLMFLFIIMSFNSILFLFADCKYYSQYEKYPDKKFNTFIFSDSHGLPLNDFAENYNIYNFSAGSDSYFDIKRKLLYLLDNGYSVETIFITADDHTLSPYRERINNLGRSRIYCSNVGFDSNYEFIKEKFIKVYIPIFEPKISPLFQSYLQAKIKNTFQSDKDQTSKKAWTDLSEDERIESAKKRMQSQFPADNKSKKLEKTLLEIFQICKINKIDLIGIKFPLSSSYIKVLGSKSYGADEIFTSKSLKVIDSKEIFVDNPEYFANQDHLNSKGGEIFTKWLLKK